MKKLLLFICISAIAAVASAQDADSYQMHVNLKNGTLCYSTDNIKKVQLKVAQQPTTSDTADGQPATDSYTAISVSGLTADFSNATETGGRSEVNIRLAGITMQAVGTTASWDEKWQSDIDFYYTLGTGNPYTASNTPYQPDGSNGLPVSGLYYKFSPKYDGVLKIGVWSNKNNRKTYIVEESSMLPVSYQMEGYINGQNDASGKKKFLYNDEIVSLHDAAGVGPYVIGTGTFFWGWITIEVEAGKHYWLLQDSSQIGFQGFTFSYIAKGEGNAEETDNYLMKILEMAGDVNIPTEDVVEITFDKQKPAPVPANPILAETIEAIPAAYAERAENRGKVVGLNYATTSYVDGQQVEKTAYVYLPWEYDYYPDRRYNVLYLMHGMGDDATTYIYGNTKELRMAIDHLIQDRIIEPLIVVTPTFYAPGAGNANINQAAVSFPTELLDCLMPTVESKYRTYAETADLTGFKASRAHRAFGGFSMGSVTTWNVFSKALPYISEFIPMSGGMTMTAGGGGVAASLAEVVSNAGLGQHDFYINAMSGSEDYAAAGLASQISQMASLSPFVLSRDREQGNIYYRSWPEGQHDYNACITYVYNSLLNLFK